MPKDPSSTGLSLREWKRESLPKREKVWQFWKEIMRKVKKYDQKKFWNKSKLQFIFLKKKIFFYEKIN